MHGGLYSDLNVTLDDIRKEDRRKEIPERGIMCETLWSDPCSENGIQPSHRGIGVRFGPDVSFAFCELNKIDKIIRSHECKNEGFEIMHDGRVTTIFSAPN